QADAAGARMDIQINPWSPTGPEPRPDTCPPGSYRRGICRQDICRPARAQRQPAEAVAGRQRLPFPRKPKKQHPGSRLSTLFPTMIGVDWNSPDAHRNNPTPATTAMNRPRSWHSRQPFFAGCCEKSTQIEVFGSRSSSWSVKSSVSGPTSEDPRKDPTGPRHIFAIGAAKCLQHHSLFSCDSAKEQDPETGHARETGDP